MSIAKKKEQPMKGPAQEKIHKIVEKLDALLSKLSKVSDYPTLQQEIDSYAKEIIEVMHIHHANIAKLEPYLKNAVIDLTEIPYMQPEMQKIAFQAGVKAAMNNMQLFLDHSMV